MRTLCFTYNYALHIILLMGHIHTPPPPPPPPRAQSIYLAHTTMYTQSHAHTTMYKPGVADTMCRFFAFVRNPWSILDAFIVGMSVLSLIVTNQVCMPTYIRRPTHRFTNLNMHTYVYIYMPIIYIYIYNCIYSHCSRAPSVDILQSLESRKSTAVLKNGPCGTMLSLSLSLSLSMLSYTYQIEVMSC